MHEMNIKLDQKISERNELGDVSYDQRNATSNCISEPANVSMTIDQTQSQSFHFLCSSYTLLNFAKTELSQIV